VDDNFCRLKKTKEKKKIPKNMRKRFDEKEEKKIKQEYNIKTASTSRCGFLFMR
jgi:hypothetical protein